MKSRHVLKVYAARDHSRILQAEQHYGLENHGNAIERRVNELTTVRAEAARM